MRTIAILAASTVLAAVGGTTAAFAYTSTQADGARGGARVQLGDAQPPSFVRSAGRIVPVAFGDDHRSRHSRHVEPGDDHGRHGGHGEHGGHGGDNGGHHRHGSDG